MGFLGDSGVCHELKTSRRIRFVGCLCTQHYHHILGALGAQEWDRICRLLRIQMSEADTRGCGTCPVHIGVRYVLNGHFGCAPLQKRVRALSGLRHALDGILGIRHPITAKAFGSNCGLIGYLVDVR